MLAGSVVSAGSVASAGSMVIDGFVVNRALKGRLGQNARPEGRNTGHLTRL